MGMVYQDLTDFQGGSQVVLLDKVQRRNDGDPVFPEII